MKKIITVLCLISIMVASCQTQRIITKSETEIFPKGQKISNDNFTGNVWLNMIVPGDTIYNTSAGSVTFEPGARTKWHYHPGGQILLITNGKGLYQEKGKPVELIKKGDVVKCPPNIPHWHGATPNDTMTHIAIGTNPNKGNVVWLQPVSDKEYTSLYKRGK